MRAEAPRECIARQTEHLSDRIQSERVQRPGRIRVPFEHRQRQGRQGGLQLPAGLCIARGQAACARGADQPGSARGRGVAERGAVSEASEPAPNAPVQFGTASEQALAAAGFQHQAAAGRAGLPAVAAQQRRRADRHLGTELVSPAGQLMQCVAFMIGSARHDRQRASKCLGGGELHRRRDPGGAGRVVAKRD